MRRPIAILVIERKKGFLGFTAARAAAAIGVQHLIAQREPAEPCSLQNPFSVFKIVLPGAQPRLFALLRRKSRSIYTLPARDIFSIFGIQSIAPIGHASLADSCAPVTAAGTSTE